MKTRPLITFGIIFALGFVGTAFVPHAFGECLSLPCDDANVKLGEPNYRFIDFIYANKIGEPIQFILERIGYGDCVSFNAEITDEDGNLVWGEGSYALCDPNENPSLVTSQIKIGYNEDNPIAINEYGRYFIKVQIDDGSIEKEFIVRPKSSVSIDRTVYPIPWMLKQPPLKQFKAGIDPWDVKCNDRLTLLIHPVVDKPYCVTGDTTVKLLERHWKLVVSRGE